MVQVALNVEDYTMRLFMELILYLDKRG